MYRHRHIRLTDLLQLHRALPDPKLDPSVPPAADHKVVIRLRVDNAKDFLDWLLMGSDWRNLVAIQVPFVNVVVRARNQDSWLVELPADSQYARRHFLDRHLISRPSWLLPHRSLFIEH